jgi:hypothetical protein
MKEAVEEVCQLIDHLRQQEQRLVLGHLRERIVLHPLETEWDINAETILSASSRSSDLTLRGVRGIIAEATFNDVVLPTLSHTWDAQPVSSDKSYDFLLHRRTDGLPLRIQVKLQRKEKQEPKRINKAQRSLLVDAPDALYVVEVQRTRTGKRKAQIKRDSGEVVDETVVQVHETRPYRFGEFDIIAVNMHPSTRQWKRFMYTVGAWLIPRAAPADHLIQIMQPVPAIRDEYWTDKIDQCIEWFLSSEKRRLYEARPSKSRSRPRKN